MEITPQIPNQQQIFIISGIEFELVKSKDIVVHNSPASADLLFNKEHNVYIVKYYGEFLNIELIMSGTDLVSNTIYEKCVAIFDFPKGVKTSLNYIQVLKNAMAVLNFGTRTMRSKIQVIVISNGITELNDVLNKPAVKSALNNVKAYDNIEDAFLALGIGTQPEQ